MLWTSPDKVKVGAATGGMVGAVGAAGPPVSHATSNATTARTAHARACSHMRAGTATGRAARCSVEDLVAAIKDYLRHHNADPKPFVWSTTVDTILDKVRKCKVILGTLY